MKRHIASGILITLLSAASLAGDLDVRHFYITNDVTSARPAAIPLKWYQGETVQLDLWIRRGSQAVDLSAAGIYPVWRSILPSDRSTLYMCETGTVLSGVSGIVHFVLSPDRTALPTNVYETWVTLYQQQGGTNRIVGTAYRGYAEVYYSPSATSSAYAGPYTNGYILDWGNVTVQGVAPYVRTDDAAYGAAITGLVGQSGISVSGDGRVWTITNTGAGSGDVSTNRSQTYVMGTTQAFDVATANALLVDGGAVSNFGAIQTWVGAQGYLTGIPSYYVTQDQANVSFGALNVGGGAVSNFAGITNWMISQGYLTAEADTLASVLARGNNAAGFSITNVNDIRSAGWFTSDGSAGGLRAGTADGADNATVSLAGGGASIWSRGSYITVSGNESSNKGKIIIGLGGGLSATNVGLCLYDYLGFTRLEVSAAGDWNFKNKALTNIGILRASSVYISDQVPITNRTPYVYAWSYATAGTNWLGVVPVAGTITRITAQTQSGSITGVVVKRSWNDSWATGSSVCNVPMSTTAIQTDRSDALNSGDVLGVRFDGGTNQPVLFAVEVMPQ